MPSSPARPLRPRSAPASADWLLFAVPSVIWGTTWFAIKFQLGRVAAEASVAYRFALASALLFAWCVARGERLRFGARAHAAFALLGVLEFALNYVLVYVAEEHLTSGVVALLFSLLVLWNIVGARLLLGTRAGRGVVVGAAIGLVGVTLVVWPDLARFGGAPGQALGVVAAVLGTVSASAGNLWSQRLYARGTAVFPSTAWAMAYGSAAVALGCALRGVPFSLDASLPYLASLAYLAVFGSVFAFVTYLTLLRRIGAGRAGYTSVVIPVLAMATSTVFEGYRWTPAALAGMVLVLAGNVLILWRRAAA